MSAIGQGLSTSYGGLAMRVLSTSYMKLKIELSLECGMAAKPTVSIRGYPLAAEKNSTNANDSH